MRLILLAACVSLLQSWPAHAQERSRWLGASGRNSQVELTVFDVTVAPLPERPGREAVTVATAWRNIAPPERMGEIEWKTSGVGGLASFGRPRPPVGREAVRHTAYLVPRVSDHVYLLTAGGEVARLDDAGELRLPRYDDEAEWAGRFEIDAADSEAMLLLFFDFDGGHIIIPLTERIPPREGDAPVSEARNDVIRARLYGSKPRGEALEVDLGLLSVSEGNAVEVELNGAMALLLPDGSVMEPVGEDNQPWFGETARILPEWEQRSRIAFEGAAHVTTGTLEISLPGREALRLPLDPSAAEPIARKAMHAWEDGPGLAFELLQAVHDDAAGDLVLHVRVANRCGSDLSFTPSVQFLLVEGGRQITLRSGDDDAEEWVVRDGATRTRELRYPLRQLPARAEILYRGFESEEPIRVEVTLP
jgi:hypothetical protein